MNTRGHVREEVFNVALGEALRSATPSTVHIERTGVLSGPGNSGKRPDILIVDRRAPPSVIECSYDATDADKDAVARLGEIVKDGHREIKTSVSLHIPSSFQSTDARKEDLIAGADIRFAIFQKTETAPRRWPDKGFVEGDVWSLATLLSAASLPKEDIERVANKVAELVDEAADVLDALPEAAKQEIDGNINRGSILTSLKTTMVLWLNSLLTQQRLHVQNVPGIPPLDFTCLVPPSHSEQIEVWRLIQESNWRAIFDPAIEILEVAGNSDPYVAGEALEKLVKAVEEIESVGLGLHINVGAELFPILSEDRKQAAAFYTQAATAELLAALTINQGDLSKEEWADNALFSNKFLADLACGTGTLLRAGYRRIQAIHKACGGGGVTLESMSALHQGAMETGLIGTDVSPIAAHLTSASLAAIGMGEPYGHTQIGWLDVGGPTDAIGSLDYFKTSQLQDLWQSVAGRSKGKKETTKSSDVPDSSVSVQDAGIDWILMNPPYSRTRGGQSAFDIAGLSEDDRKACQTKWKNVVRKEPVKLTAGMGASFLALARKKVKLGGRIGFVLPLTAAFAESWAVTRQMIELDFTDITAITVAAGQALGKDALSADTGMEEMLLVATRTPRDPLGKNNPIKCVTLHAPVTRSGEAGELARAISDAIGRVEDTDSNRPIFVGETEVGQVCVFDAGGEGAPWGPLGVTHAGLAIAANKMVCGRLDLIGTPMELDIGMTTLGDLFGIGPTHHLIGHLRGGDAIGAFELFPVTRSVDAVGDDRSLWAADSETQRSLVVLPTHWGVPVKGGKWEDMRARQSRLFYARNMRWTSQALLVALTKHDAMGGRAWNALESDDIRVCKAFALWANSTFGMMVHWTQGQRTQAGRSTTQVGALGQIPCPKLNKIGDDELDLAATKFDEMDSKKMLPACQSHADETRQEIDAAVIRMLGLPEGANKTVDELRLLWCSEPSVHGQNKQAVSLLAKKNA